MAIVPCSQCGEPCEDNNCDACDTIDGRFVEAVAEYAQTCDLCGELTMNESLAEDPATLLGYCEGCVDRLPEAIQRRITQLRS